MILPRRNDRGRWIDLPSWFTFVFGGTDRLPRSNGGGSRWRPNLYRSVRKYYREDWSNAGYTLRDWLTR